MAERYAVATFASTFDALEAERCCREAGVPGAHHSASYAPICRMWVGVAHASRAFGARCV